MYRHSISQLMPKPMPDRFQDEYHDRERYFISEIRPQVWTAEALQYQTKSIQKLNQKVPHELASACIFAPTSKHCPHGHEGSGVWICPCRTIHCKSKVRHIVKRNVNSHTDRPRWETEAPKHLITENVRTRAIPMDFSTGKRITFSEQREARQTHRAEREGFD